MARGKNLRGSIQEEEEEEKEKPVIEVSSGDDDEANEDLSLKIIEKSLLMRAAKLDQNDNEVFVLNADDGNWAKNDSGLVGISGGGGDKGKIVELAASSLVEVEPVVKNPTSVKKRKKKKIQKMETGEPSGVIAKEVENAETLENEEPTEKAEAVQSTVELIENGDTSAFEMPENTVLRKLLRGPRYFDPPDSGWSTCYNCGKEGHMAVNCPSFQKKKRPCFLCGSLEHGFKQCSKERVCIICKSSGHRMNRCPAKHKGGPQSSKICLKCGDPGHDLFSCKNNYSLVDLKEIQCYICKSFGHLCCANIIDNSPREVSCYTCGELGHTGLECTSFHEEATTAASPNVCYRCGEGGHFARECTSSAKIGKRNHELSTNALRFHREDKEKGFKSAPQDLGKSRKRRKHKSEEQSKTTPKKSKRRGGWLTEDPEVSSKSKSKKNRWRSPSTPSYKGHQISVVSSGGRISNSQSSKRMYKSHSGVSGSQSYKRMQDGHLGFSSFQGSTTPYKRMQDGHLGFSSFQGSTTPYERMQDGHLGFSSFQGSTTPYENRYSASRFSSSGRSEFRGKNYNWW